MKNKSYLNYIKENKAVFIISVILRLSVIAILVRSIFLRNFDNAFVCLFALLLFNIPAIFKKSFHMELPGTLEIIVLFFIYAAEILGELQCYYIQYAYWDTMLHITWGFLCTALGFSLIDLINRDSKIKFSLSPIFVAIVAFCFSMTVGVLWEFGEFSADNLFHTDTQKDTVITEIHSTFLDPDGSNKAHSITDIESVSVNGEDLEVGGYLDIGLYDTMEDLFVNFIGAVVFSIIGYFYIKKRGKGKFAKQFIPVIDNEIAVEEGGSSETGENGSDAKT